MQNLINTGHTAPGLTLALLGQPPTVEAPAPAATLAPAHGFAPADIRGALLQLLASKEFCKAQRSCRLMRFLVEQELAGAVRETAEYAIGIEVFDRHADSYSTCDDPIVRVQVGRLRERLKAYYAGSGIRAALRFSIPIGSYMPVISRNGHAEGHFPSSHLLAIMPLLCFTQDGADAAFTQGLSEELAYQLFKVFGHKIVSHTFTPADDASARGAIVQGVSHLLEGSVRVHGDLIRASLRLVDAGAGCIAWSEQFDRRGPFAIALQEELALAICSALKLYFAHG